MGTTADKLLKIYETKKAIAEAIREVLQVDMPEGTIFSEYPDYMIKSYPIEVFDYTERVANVDRNGFKNVSLENLRQLDKRFKSTIFNPAVLFTPSGYGSTALYPAKPNFLSDGDVPNFSCRRLSNKTRVNAQGKVALCYDGVPSIEHIAFNEDGSSRKCVVRCEASGTNLFKFSNDFTGADWQAGDPDFTITPGSQDSPILNETSTLLQATGDARLMQNAVSINTTYTLSVWLKAKGRASNVKLLINNGTAGGVIVRLTNEWVRYSLTATVGGTLDTGGRSGIKSEDDGMTGENGIMVAGFQIEPSSYMTSYIPTTTTTETRLSDQIENLGNEELFVEDLMSVVVKFSSFENTPSANRFISISGGWYDNRVTFLFRGSNTNAVRVLIVGNDNYFPNDIVSEDIVENRHYGLTYNSTSTKLFHEGEKTSDLGGPTSLPASGIFNDMSLSEIGNGTGLFVGDIEKFDVYNEVLSEETMKVLTSYDGFLDVVDSLNYTVQ